MPVRKVVDCLLAKLEKAAADFGYDKIVLAGGVSANSRLRSECAALCGRRKWKLYLPEPKYCGDNAAMVASQGYYEFLSGVRGGAELNAYATMPIDIVNF